MRERRDPEARSAEDRTAAGREARGPTVERRLTERRKADRRNGGEFARAGDTAVLREAVDRLRAEAEGLRRAMRTRGVIEQAKGILAERLGCTPDEAFGHLVRLSQDSNRRLAEIAAGLVGLAAPLGEPRGESDTGGAPAEDIPAEAVPVADASVEDTPTEEPGTTEAPASPPPKPPVPAPVLPGNGPAAPVPGLSARYHLAASALASAGSPDELARLAHEVALAPLGVVAVVLGRLEPDGALRLVGSHGVEPRRVSQWQRIPPETGVPLAAAAHGGGLVWEFDSDQPGGAPDTGRIVPGRSACAVPLRRGDRIVGAMSLGWDAPPARARAATRFVDALAGLVAGHLLRFSAPDGDEPGLAVPGGEHWFRAVLDAVFDPVLVLSAVREGPAAGAAQRGITDLRVRYANAAAGTDPQVGRRLSELHPGLVTTGTFARIVTAVATGVGYQGRSEDFTDGAPGQALAVRAEPFLDGVLLTWRPANGAAERVARLGEEQRMAGVGSVAWTVGRPPELSAEALRLLGLDPDRTDPVSPKEALAQVHPDDRPALRLLVRRLLAGRRTAALEFDVGRAGGTSRTVRLIAEAPDDPGAGRPAAVRGVLQDVTRRHRTEQALAETRARLAEQRRRAGAEHRTARALQNALLSVPGEPEPPAAVLEHAARYLPAAERPRIGGDWYDLADLPDGRILLAVGDVSGHGLAATVGMAELRHALRGLCYTGTGPAEMLDRLNTMLCHQGGHRIASVLCGLLDPAAATLTWSAAGHSPPAVLRDGTAVLAEGPTGTVLGALPETRCREAVLPLRPGTDTVLLWTDGLLNRREGGTVRPDRLLRAAAECGTGEPEACLDHIAARLGGPNPADDSCLLAVRLRPRESR
ncbi:SpoIIE family protein phosphatase [Kitasatospora sp. NPDC093550]|uniref:SpoIIE family protein phosphatase n=1 Tax=Kitasatospora sp. NPDC093550 TaxID=3364089 RepID=UPI0038020F98